jgi:methyl-accepting chemotaxis protein
MKFLGIEDTKNLFSGLGSSTKSLEEYISKIRSIEEEINSAFNQLFTARFGNLVQEYISKGDIKNVPDTIKEEFNNLLNIINILYKDLESSGKASITKLITSSSALKSILTNIKDTFLNLFRITTESISGVKEKITELGSEVAGKNYTVIKSIYMPEDLTSEKIEQFIKERTKILNDAIRSMNLIVEMADNLLLNDYFKNFLSSDNKKHPA